MTKGQLTRSMMTIGTNEPKGRYRLAEQSRYEAWSTMKRRFGGVVKSGYVMNHVIV